MVEGHEWLPRKARDTQFARRGNTCGAAISTGKIFSIPLTTLLARDWHRHSLFKHCQAY